MAALETELRKLGAQVETTETDLLIDPPARVTPCRIATYDDHRMAMSFAVAGLVVEGIVIQDPDCVRKTFPGFFDELQAPIGVRATRPRRSRPIAPQGSQARTSLT